MDSDEDGVGDDVYLQRVKREGKARDVDDEEDESTDEDYMLPDSHSEVDEEWVEDLFLFW